MAEKVDYEKEMALYALRYAKDIIEFQHRQLSSMGSIFRMMGSTPEPPLGCINDAI